MGKRKVNPQEKRRAIARILSKTTSYGEEAERLGLQKSTLHEAAQKLKPNDGEDPAADPAAGDTALDAAKKAIGQAPPGGKTPLTKEELLQAGPDQAKRDADYCVSTINGAKAMLVFGGGMVMGIPVLQDEQLPKIRAMNPEAEAAVRAAAPELAPLLKKWLPEGSSLAGVAFALLIDGAMTFMAMRAIAAEYRAKREAEEAAKKKAAA